MHLTPHLVLICSLLWSMQEGKLTPTDAFTILGILAIISNPTHILPPLLSEVRSALASAETIQAYLLAAEIQSQNGIDLVDLRSKVHSDQDSSQPENEIKFSRNLLFELRNASLSVSGEIEPILQHVNMVVCEGVVLTVVGRNGSGKSTILRSITGDTRISGGLRYKQPVRVAYCGQTPWLPNKSIRRTIVAYNELNAEWYSAVIDACILIPDLRSLIKRDHTVISTNGANLSGGQKQRIALARAVYCRAPLLVLDDIFSSLYPPTAMEIQPGYSGLMGFSGDSLQLLLYLPVLPPTFSSPIKHYSSILTVRQSSASLQQFQTWVKPDSPSRMNPWTKLPKEACSTMQTRKYYLLPTKKKDAERTIDWSLFWFYNESFAKAQFVFCIVVYFVASLLEVSPAVYVGMWLEMPLSSSDVYSNSYIIFCVVMTVLLNGSTAWWTICMLAASSEKLHEMLLGTTLDATLHFLTSKDFSHVLALFKQDIRTASEALPIHFIKTVYFNMIVLFQVGIVVSCSMYAVWSYPILVSSIYLIQGQYLRVIGPLQSAEIDSNTAMNVQLTDTTRGLEHIRAFGWQFDNIEEALACLNTSQRIFQYLKTTGQWLSVMLETVKLVSGMLLVLVATCATATTTGPKIGPSLMVALTMSWEMNDLVSMSAGLLSSVGALRRIREFVNNTPQERKPSAKEQVTTTKDWPPHGEVIMSEVSAKYDRSETSPAILKDLSFTIAPGQKVGIVGRTGSGKTSLLMTILNSLEYTGTITIDGIDISKVAPLALRASVTTLSQDFIEFDNTVRFNLCP